MLQWSRQNNEGSNECEAIVWPFIDIEWKCSLLISDERIQWEWLTQHLFSVHSLFLIALKQHSVFDLHTVETNLFISTNDHWRLSTDACIMACDIHTGITEGYYWMLYHGWRYSTLTYYFYYVCDLRYHMQMM